jgi:hypothetical protein
MPVARTIQFVERNGVEPDHSLTVARAGPSTTFRAGTRPRAESHDPPLQSLKPFLEPALLGPVALGDRIGEGERQRVAFRFGSFASL